MSVKTRFEFPCFYVYINVHLPVHTVMVASRHPRVVRGAARALVVHEVEPRVPFFAAVVTQDVLRDVLVFVRQLLRVQQGFQHVEINRLPTSQAHPDAHVSIR